MSKLKKLNYNKNSEKVKQFKDFFQTRVVGQKRVIKKLIENFELLNSGLRDKDRPIFTALFLGPSGVGKTYIAEVLAEYYFENPKAFTKIACAELSESHKISMLLGAPPGYVGFIEAAKNESSSYPLLSSWSINKYAFFKLRKDFGYHNKTEEELIKEVYNIKEKIEQIKQGTKEIRKSHNFNNNLLEEINQLKKRLDAIIFNPDSEFYISIILFDEIEKANPVVFNVLLEIMDKGQVTLAHGQKVNLNNSYIILTSNVGAKDIENVFQDKQIGFKVKTRSSNEIDKMIYQKAIQAAQEIFSPEFRGRLDTIEVFRYLTKKQMFKILENQIKDLHTKLAKEFPIQLIIPNEVKKFIVEQATDRIEYGARLLKNKLYHFVIKPLSKLKNSRKIKEGDSIKLKVKNNKILFFKKGV